MTFDAKKRRARHVASDEAHAWARSLPLNNPNAKTVLRALALYVNGEGSCFVSIEQLAEDTDLSSDTVRRRLIWLEQIGVIVRLPQWLDGNGRRNSEGKGKRTTDEIRMLLQADIDDIERSASGLENAENSDNSSTQTTSISPSSQQGLNSELETVSPALALGQPSQSCEGLISEPEPLNSPPNPPPGGVRSDEDRDGSEAAVEPEHFAYFKSNYPDRDRWSWDKVLPLFGVLTPAEQYRAAAASPEYAKIIERTKRKPPPVRPERFLKEGIFKNFEHARLPEKQPELPPKVFYPEDSDVCQALKAAHLTAKIEFRTHFGEGEQSNVRGVARRGEIGNDLLAMAAFADSDTEDFPAVVEEGSESFGAWRKKLKTWTGFEVVSHKIWKEPHDPAVHDLPFSHRDFRFRKSVKGLRVPHPWPPLKDGSWSKTGPPTTASLMTEDDYSHVK